MMEDAYSEMNIPDFPGINWRRTVSHHFIFMFSWRLVGSFPCKSINLFVPPRQANPISTAAEGIPLILRTECPRSICDIHYFQFQCRNC